MSLDAFGSASMDATRCPKPNERNEQREQVEATSGAGCVEWFVHGLLEKSEQFGEQVYNFQDHSN